MPVATETCDGESDGNGDGDGEGRRNGDGNGDGGNEDNNYAAATSLKLEKNVFITSDNIINARRIDDDNARMIASLASLPPVVSGVANTAATVAPSSDDVLLGSGDDI
jgi:hypothetical protein